MKRDLTWTGNQFLDPAAQLQRAVAAMGAIDLTHKEEVWAESVAVALAGHLGLPEPFVRVAAGATQMIDAVLRSVEHGLVVDVVPNFHLTATLAGQEGWTYRSVPVREPGELLAALGDYLDREDAVISLSSPRNPLGYQFPVAEIARLLDRAAGVVLVDEVYADFAPDTTLRLVTEHPNLVVARTLSKAWGLASLRVGYGVSARFADPGFRLRLLPNSVSGPAQLVAKHLIGDPAAVRRSIEEARACRVRLLAQLRAVPGLHVWPSDANYVCVETPAAAEVDAALAGAGYAVRLLHDLRGYPPSWPTGVRITVPPQPAVDEIVACIRRVHARTGALTNA